MKLKFRLNKIKSQLRYLKQCFLHIVNHGCEIEKKAYKKGWVEGFSKARRFKDMQLNQKKELLKELERSWINDKDYNCG